MLIGPAFGGIAVIITAFTVSLPVIAFTRLLEGASTAASVPSILGFIAFATAADELLRGKAVARFEAATLAGLMAGFVVGGLLFQALGPIAFLANALVYLVSFLIYRYGVPEHAEPEPAARAHDPEEGLRRYAADPQGQPRVAARARRGSPSTRRSACSRARRCSSSSASRAPSSPTSS